MIVFCFLVGIQLVAAVGWSLVAIFPRKLKAEPKRAEPFTWWSEGHVHHGRNR